MKNIPSQHMQASISAQHLKWAQSVDSVLNQGVDMGIPKGTDATGVYNQFDPGNSSGILIRVGAAGSAEKITWPSSGALAIQHTLGRQPIGFKIVDKDMSVDVYRSGTPDKTTISLIPTSTSANVTLYIF